MAHRRTRSCAFGTDRLEVGPWHDLCDRYGINLLATISTILTERTTAALPPDWQGAFDHNRAQEWMSSRDAESPTLLVIDRATSRAIGFVVLFETATDRDGASGVDVRLGYVFAESVWGRGLGTELVSGLVDWAREQPAIDSISGGVRTDNEASARVLLKNGFRPTDSHDGEQIHQHHLD